MMFNPEAWIEKSWTDDDSQTVTIAGEEVRIRRLNGTQWEQYARAVNGKSEDSSIAVVLQHGLVKGFGQYSYDEMVKFYNACPVLADKIAGAIVEHTLERMTAEQKVLEDAEKNSAATIVPPSSGDGAGNTDKTLKPPASAGENSSDSPSTSN